MKLALTQVSLVGLILLAIICFSLLDYGINNNTFEIGPPKLDFNRAENYEDGAFPIEGSFIRCLVKAGTAPTPYDNFFAIRQAPPVWEKTLSEYVLFPVNFFRPIMVIIIFLYFYQSSRNGAGLDHLNSFSAAR